MSDTHSGNDALLPAGLPLLESAAWIGCACWVELRLVEIISGWLGDSDDADASWLWSIRSAAAQRAESFHRRLPVLIEFPRSEFVSASSSELESKMRELGFISAGEASGAARQQALGSVLGVLAAAYEARQDISSGPADSPLAATLTSAADDLRASIDSSALDCNRNWVETLESIGCP